MMMLIKEECLNNLNSCLKNDNKTIKKRGGDDNASFL